MGMEEFRELLRNLGIQIQNLSLYEEALTHRSFLNETRNVVSSNERVEFLGDSVLSLIISSFLFKMRVQDEEGELTNLRAYIVKTDSLAKAALKLNLGNFLRLSKGEELSGGRTNTQILANTYEAVLGAIYLDLGLDQAIKFVETTLLPYFEDEIKKGAPPDPKSHLQEVVQSQFKVSPRYKILATSGPDHAKQFLVGVFMDGKQIGKGQGSSKQQAEEKAAKGALERLTKKQE